MQVSSPPLFFVINSNIFVINATKILIYGGCSCIMIQKQCLKGGRDAFCDSVENMTRRMIKAFCSATLILAMVLPCIVVPSSVAAADSAQAVSCRVSYAMPAICCDVGQTVKLSDCGVQFDASSPTVYGAVTWKNGSSAVTDYTPDKAGAYPLTASNNGKTLTVYVVAKNASDSDYTLYYNDFSTAPTDFRIVQQTSGATVSTSGGNYVLNASGAASYYIRALLPAWLDAFGDVKIETSMQISSAIDERKWAAVMYRVQNSNYPYLQGCVRYNSALSDGVELSRKNESNAWDMYRTTSFSHAVKDGYNLYTIEADGVYNTFSINGTKIIERADAPYANGAMGFQVRGVKLSIDFVKVSLKGNKADSASAAVSYSKPAIRVDMGETVDLASTKVQFGADSLYTAGSALTWTKNGTAISKYTPTAIGVEALTVSNGTASRTVYMVTRSLNDGEYTLYYNDFSTAPSDFRIVQQTSGTTIKHDATAGTYVINASSSTDHYGRVLLPSWLDVFGDVKVQAYLRQSANNTQTNWSSLMYRVQGGDYPYMHVCLRYDAALENGLEIAERNASNKWAVVAKGAYANKNAEYNTVAVEAFANETVYSINGTKVLTYNGTPYNSGAVGVQAKGLTVTVDAIRVTLGERSEKEDTAVATAVSYQSPVICCNVGQTVLLSECPVQFNYGVEAIDPAMIVWKKDGKVITEFAGTTEGIHTLTATCGTDTFTVLVIAKKANAAEHVLYYNDFSAAPTGFRAIENGGSISTSSGSYVMNASATADTYIRVLLPNYLDVVGDYTYTASVKMTSPTNNTKWSALMYRVQNSDKPYLQACLRYDATTANGTEISNKTAAGDWVVTQKGSYTGLTAGAFNTVTLDVSGKTTDYYINGTKVLTEAATLFTRGALGFQARGLNLSVDYVKVTARGNTAIKDLYLLPGGFADVRDIATGISVGPAMVSELKTLADFNIVLTDSPAVAIMTYRVSSGVASVVFADGTVSPDTALGMLGGRVIPAFRIENNTDADSLAAYLKAKDMRDAYAVSKTPSVVDRAYSKWKHIRGVVDYSDVTAVDAEALRNDALAGSARVLMLTDTVTSKAAVTKIQDRYSVAWLVVGEGKAASVSAINKGAYGIVTPNRAVTEQCLTTYYPDNTLTRRSNVIGHRGVPSLAQENSLAGAITAYENGATMVENDIYKVADGVLMVMHDSTIDRTTNGTGNTTGFTSTQLSKYKIDSNANVPTEPVPSLEQYFQEIKGKNQGLVIEIKPNDTTLSPVLASLIKQYDIMDQVVIISFQTAPMTKLRESLPGVPIGYLSSAFTLDETDPINTAVTVLDSVQTYGSVFNPSYKGLGENLLRELAYRGVTVWPWTINTQSTFDEYFTSSVAGITTNYSQWSKTLVSSLEYTNGTVKSTTYTGTVKDVSATAELVVVEDSLGISYSGGKLNVPSPKQGGKASFFFRLKSTTPTGISYYTVTELQTVEVERKDTLELVEITEFSVSDGYLKGITEKHTVKLIKEQFVYEVEILDVDGNVLSDSSAVPTGSVIRLAADNSQQLIAIFRGDIDCDGRLSAGDYISMKNYLKNHIKLSVISKMAADLAEDGRITSLDAIALTVELKQ